MLLCLSFYFHVDLKKKKKVLILIFMLNLQKMTQKLMGKMDMVSEESPLLANGVPPAAPPLPGPATTSYHRKGLVGDGKCCSVNAATRDLWDQLFDKAYGADLRINTDNGGILYAHASILVSCYITIYNSITGKQKLFSLTDGIPH